MADIDTLRPEVREAVDAFDIGARVGMTFGNKTWNTIRAELLRLADENASLHDLVRHHSHCVNTADAELAALKARIGALMLEFCPDDMTEEQCAAWAARQQAVED